MAYTTKTRSKSAVLRECPRHGAVIHHRVRDGRGGYRIRCKRCVGEAVLRRKKEIKRILVTEHGGRCEACGYDRCVGALTFHHIDPSTKSFPMSMDTSRSMETFREEAKKCILLCANCHGEAEDVLRTLKSRDVAKRVKSNGKRPVAVQRCRKHGLTDFALYGVKRPRSMCKRCTVEAGARRSARVKRLLVEIAGGRCAVCGYVERISNLQFHHVDPAKKSFQLRVARSKSLAACRAEVTKCVLVCANCHAEIEARLIESPPPGATYSERS